MSFISGQDWNPVVFSKSNNNEKKKDTTPKNEEDDIIIPQIKISTSNSNIIKNKRCLMKLTQKDLAKKLSVSSKTIQDYECGKAVPDFSTMLKLEKVLSIKLNKKKTQS